MSTRIYGYIMKNMSMSELIKFNIKHKLEIDIIKNRIFRKLLIEYFTKEYDEITFKMIIHSDNNMGKNILDTIINDIIYEIDNPKAKKFNSYDEIYFDITAVYYPLNNKNMLVYVSKQFNIDNEFDQYFNSIAEFSDYHYQNSTDKPDDISTRKWNKRRSDWDKVFNNKICNNGYGNIIGGGMSYKLCDKYLTYQNYTPDTDMLDYIPTKEIRCKTISKNIFISEYIANETNNISSKELLNSDYTRYYFKGIDLIRNQDERYLSIYDDTMSKLLDIDMDTLNNAVYIV